MTWSDHSHYEYAEARHDHHREYADQGHDHCFDYAEKHHRHYDDERAVEDLQREVRELWAALHGYEADLEKAAERIRELEQQTPQAAAPPIPRYEPSITDACERRYHRQCPPDTTCDCYCHAIGEGQDEEHPDEADGFAAAELRGRLLRGGEPFDVAAGADPLAIPANRIGKGQDEEEVPGGAR